MRKSFQNCKMSAWALLLAVAVLTAALSACAAAGGDDAPVQPAGEPAPAVQPEPEPAPMPAEEPDAPLPGAVEESAGDLIAQLSADGSILDAMLDSYSHKEFAPGAVNDDDLTDILQAGVRAPSARNMQPWHFSVVRTAAAITPYVQSAQDGNVLVIVSGATEQIQGVDVSLDCGLATENIYIAAQALGYGAHIYMAPADAMNQNKADLGIPDGYSALVAVLISQPTENADADAVTGASPRNAFDEMVTYVD